MKEEQNNPTPPNAGSAVFNHETSRLVDAVFPNAKEEMMEMLFTGRK